RCPDARAPSTWCREVGLLRPRGDLDRPHRYGELGAHPGKALEQVVARVLDDVHAFELQRLLAKATQEDLGLDWLAPALL
ncbi:hypothetical protein, partial [Pseudomonas sp. DC418]|uniref:hypothetical protein n=1 Tax=Pseudomonas sp. DC418 TaxID=3418478 RepID=UPI003D292A4C